MTVTPRSPLATAASVVVIGLATARLTRLVTKDWLGEWLLVRPAKRWSNKAEVAEAAHRAAVLSDDTKERCWRCESDNGFHEQDCYGLELDIQEAARVSLLESEHTEGEPRTWKGRLTHGLDCPFCVGFWIGGAVLVGAATIGRSRLAPLWRLATGALALNYVVGHVSSKLD